MKYFAFISYKRENEDWAKWFQNELENYHLPSSLNGRADINLSGLPKEFRKEFRPVFRDIDELKAGNLPEQIYKALEDSLNLVVICSHLLADDEEAKWVNKEITDFIDIRKKVGADGVKHIFPFIVDGVPHAGDERECFPKAFRVLSDDRELIGGNVNEGGNVTDDTRERAFVKVLAGMLPGIEFRDLWDRYEQDKIKKEREEKEQKDRLLILQSRFIAEKATKLVDEGDSYLAQRLLLEVLPKNVDNSTDRPLATEAESVLRSAVMYNSAILKDYRSCVNSVLCSPNGKMIVSASGGADGHDSLRISSCETGKHIWSPIELGNCGVNCGVQFATFNHDGNLIVTASGEDIRIWNVATRTQIGKPIIGHNLYLTTVSFSPDGKRIVSASHDKTIRIWDVETGKQIGRPLEGHTDHVCSAFFNPNDGKLIVSASRDGTIRIWDSYSGRQIGNPLDGDSLGVNYAEFSYDGKRIVSASNDGTVRIWDALTGFQIGKPLEGHTGHVNSAVFSHDGKRVVSASDDGTIRIWDAFSLKQVGATLVGHTKRVSFAAFCMERDRCIISASHDETVRIWDVATGNKKGWWYRSGVIAFSSDGRRIVSIEGPNRLSMKIWDGMTATQVGQDLIGHTGNINTVAFSPDNKFIISTSVDNTLRIWDANTGVQIGKTLKGHAGNVRFAEFSHDGKLIVSASEDRTVRIWNFNTGMLLLSPLEGHSKLLLFAMFSPNNRFVVSVSADCTMRIWDVINGTQVGNPLEGHTDTILSISFSKDSNSLASASKDGTVRVWDIHTGKLIGKSLVGHTFWVYSAVFNHDGSRIVSASADKTIRLWDVATCKQIGSPLCGHTEGVDSASFSPDSRYIISHSGDNTIRIWDTSTGLQVGPLLVIDEGLVCSAAFIPDHKYLNTELLNNSKRLWYEYSSWNMSQRRSIVSFDSDGRRIVAASSDGTIRIWDFPSLQNLINQTRERFKDYPLSPEEKRNYYLE